MIEHAETLKVIVFRLENEEYAIPVDMVGSIERMQKITRIPKTPSFIKGVINLRGVVTPVIDLRDLFGMEEAAYSSTTRMIIVQTDDKEVGMIVDEANDVVDLQESDIEATPEVVGAIDQAYIRGIVKLDQRLLIILNIANVLTEEHSSQLSTAK